MGVWMDVGVGGGRESQAKEGRDRVREKTIKVNHCMAEGQMTGLQWNGFNAPFLT